ncbi:monovalent cation:proton antiporter-2 (CPA2) family protein [Blastomonas aquatica]|uniref:Potassium transporter TrkA n=1 Tax=Blastomonas aquatica TaxID=1510276 RepID=A0ABQ1JFM1_9SPHN|nr:monovalent cation:proton antiporter-2 (CPA2) family protein [Blastomonas aquatica]GGB67770.1 potassium transporter TrkA [Blastomonas aquatica]
MDHGGDIFLSGTVLLAAALGFVLLFRRLGLGAVLGYLVGGIIIGPEVLQLVADPELIVSFAEIGIVLLLFLVGLELAPQRLWQLKRDIFGLGLSQVALCGVALAVFVYFVTGSSWGAALGLGLPLALSSTAQVLPLLQSQGRLNTPTGERAFSILLFQDLSIVPLLTIIAAMSRAPQTGPQTPGWLTAIYALAAIAGLVAAGRYGLAPLLKLIGKVAERELFIVAGLFAVFGSAALMHSIGISAALGAFVAGVMLADSPFRHELEADIDPFRSILLGLFFLGVGMMLDLGVILADPMFIVTMALALVAIKVAIIFGLAKAFGMENRAAFVLGLLLSQGGEFAFVLFAEAQAALLIAPEAASRFGAIVTLSMATTPFLMLATRLFGGVRGSCTEDMDDPELARQSSAIVIGHGRFGQAVAQIFAGANISVTLIDINPDQIRLSGEFGRKVFYGDGTRIDLLRRAGAEQASALLFCMDDKDFGPDQIAPVAHAFPEAQIFVRANDRRQLLALKHAPIAAAQRELFESSVKLAHTALLRTGIDPILADRVVEEFRKRDCERLELQMEQGSMHAGKHLSFGALDSQAFDPEIG